MLELRRVQQLKAMLAGYEVELVAGLAATGRTAWTGSPTSLAPQPAGSRSAPVRLTG